MSERVCLVPASVPARAARSRGAGFAPTKAAQRVLAESST